jgi:hypothetical protein
MVIEMPEKAPENTKSDPSTPSVEQPPSQYTGSGKKISREELERMSSELVRSLHRRAVGRRFKPVPADARRLQFARACIQAIQAHASLIRDAEIEELKQMIKDLNKHT